MKKIKKVWIWLTTLILGILGLLWFSDSKDDINIPKVDPEIKDIENKRDSIKIDIEELDKKIEKDIKNIEEEDSYLETIKKFKEKYLQ